MVNSKNKFKASRATKDDGFKDYPTATSGSVTITNGGSQSIMISGNVLFGNSTSKFKELLKDTW